MERINNLPNYANEYNYIIVTDVDNELWFYGAFNDENKAYNIAKKIDGLVIRNEEE